MPMTAEAMEERIDKTLAASQSIDMDMGGVQFRTMIEVMEFAKMMAVSDLAVPPHLRLNPGACLAICTKALRNGFDPFALAEHSFAMDKEVEVTTLAKDANGNLTGGRSVQKQKVQIIAYDSAVIRAVINAHAPIVGTISYSFKGEGDARICTASATLKSTGETVSIDSPTLGQRKKDIGTSDRGNLKGSPLWTTKPDQQQSYDTGRDLCRRYFPETLLGWYDKDEYDENPKDITPKEVAKPSIGTRLSGKGKQAGFDGDNVTKALEAKPEPQVLDTSIKPKQEMETVPAAGQTIQEEHKPADIDIETELAAKKEAILNCTTKADLRDLTELTTDMLKEAGRTDLLNDFMSAVVKREKKLKS